MIRRMVEAMNGFLVCAVIMLAGCGGGGGDAVSYVTPDTGTPTPMGTPVDLTSFKNVFYGKTSGAKYSFDLTGTNQENKTVTATYTVIADGPNFVSNNGQALNRARTILTMQVAGGSSVTNTTETYFMAADDSLFGHQDGAGLQYFPKTSTSVIPTTIKVGDTGTIGTLGIPLGQVSGTTIWGVTTLDAVWRLDAGTNGASKLVVTYTVNTSGTGPDTERDTFTLDANGIPTHMSIYIKTTHLGTTTSSMLLGGNRK